MPATERIENIGGLALPSACDVAALSLLSVAVTMTGAVIKTPIGIPGHSALLWLPVLVLAGTRRGGFAAGAAVLGGGLGMLCCGLKVDELAALLAAGAIVEAFSLNRQERPHLLPIVLAGLAAHLGKLALKTIGLLAGGHVLNAAGLPLAATAALYVAFGSAAGLIAWSALSGWQALHSKQKSHS